MISRFPGKHPRFPNPDPVEFPTGPRIYYYILFPGISQPISLHKHTKIAKSRIYAAFRQDPHKMCASPPRTAKTSLAPLGLGELFHLHNLRQQHWHDD